MKNKVLRNPASTVTDAGISQFPYCLIPYTLITLSILCGLMISCDVTLPPDEFDNPLDPEEVEEQGLETPALVFFPDEVSVNVGGSVTIQVFAMEVDALAGSYIDVSYDKNRLSVLSVSEGDFFSGAEETIFLSENDPVNGILQIHTSYLGGDTVSVFGTGSLASIVFTAMASGQSTLRYDTLACELADPDDNPIMINGFGEGVINAE